MSSTGPHSARSYNTQGLAACCARGPKGHCGPLRWVGWPSWGGSPVPVAPCGLHHEDERRWGSPSGKVSWPGTYPRGGAVWRCGGSGGVPVVGGSPTSNDGGGVFLQLEEGEEGASHPIIGEENTRESSSREGGGNGGAISDFWRGGGASAVRTNKLLSVGVGDALGHCEVEENRRQSSVCGGGKKLK
jgi:hypothetical protein